MGRARSGEIFRRVKPVAASPPSAPPPPPAPARRARILLAEDNRINQKLALLQLHKLGYTADAVANGLEVLQELQAIPYDIVLMDCQMAEMDGYEAAGMIRQRERAPSSLAPRPSPIYIIAITANAMQGDREKCLAAGMDDYISKPVRLAELQAALERWRPAAVPPVGPAVSAPAPGARGTDSNAATVAVTGTGPAAVAPEEPPVDLERLREMTDDDPKSRRELVDLYLAQAEELMQALQAARQAGSARDLERAAHILGGSSSTCGMTGLVAPLRELEQLGSAGRLPENEQLLTEARRQLDRIRQFLATQMDPG